MLLWVKVLWETLVTCQMWPFYLVIPCHLNQMMQRCFNSFHPWSDSQNLIDFFLFCFVHVSVFNNYFYGEKRPQKNQWMDSAAVPVLTISLFPGFCALLVAAPIFHLVQMRRSHPSGKTRWPLVSLLSQRTPMLIVGTTHQVRCPHS